MRDTPKPKGRTDAALKIIDGLPVEERVAVIVATLEAMAPQDRFTAIVALNPVAVGLLTDEQRKRVAQAAQVASADEGRPQ
jgi:hypothetical protein